MESSGLGTRRAERLPWSFPGVMLNIFNHKCGTGTNHAELKLLMLGQGSGCSLPGGPDQGALCGYSEAIEGRSFGGGGC